MLTWEPRTLDGGDLGIEAVHRNCPSGDEALAEPHKIAGEPYAGNARGFQLLNPGQAHRWEPPIKCYASWVCLYETRHEERSTRLPLMMQLRIRPPFGIPLKVVCHRTEFG